MLNSIYILKEMIKHKEYMNENENEKMKKLAITKINFGKYKNLKTWEEVVEEDRQYAEWLLTISKYEPLTKYLVWKLKMGK